MTKAKVIPIVASNNRVMQAEQEVIGSILFEPKAFAPVQAIISASDFADPKHAVVFQAILDCQELECKSDYMVIVEYLHRTGQTDKAGGPAYIATLCDNIGSASQAEYFAKIVREASMSRQHYQKCKENLLTAEQVLTGDMRLHDALEKNESDLFEISKNYYRSHNIYTVGEVVTDELARLEGLATAGRQVGIMSGLVALDHIIHSFQATELTYLAARPGVGKTGLALNIANNCNVPVGFFSLEMSGSELAKRQLSLISGIDGWAIKTLRLDPSQWAALAQASLDMQSIKVFIDDKPQLTIQELRSRSRQLVAKYQVKMIIIDYLQIMKTVKGRSREQEIGEISSQLKAMAKELNIAVLCLAQLNRDAEKNETGKPKLSNLRESGSLEQDADMVIFLWPVNKDSMEVNFSVAKNRNGRTGEGRLVYNKAIQKFYDVERMD